MASEALQRRLAAIPGVLECTVSDETVALRVDASVEPRLLKARAQVVCAELGERRPLIVAGGRPLAGAQAAGASRSSGSRPSLSRRGAPLSIAVASLFVLTAVVLAPGGSDRLSPRSRRQPSPVALAPRSPAVPLIGPATPGVPAVASVASVASVAAISSAREFGSEPLSIFGGAARGRLASGAFAGLSTSAFALGPDQAATAPGAGSVTAGQAAVAPVTPAAPPAGIAPAAAPAAAPAPTGAVVTPSGSPATAATPAPAPAPTERTSSPLLASGGSAKRAKSSPGKVPHRGAEAAPASSPDPGPPAGGDQQVARVNEPPAKPAKHPHQADRPDKSHVPAKTPTPERAHGPDKAQAPERAHGPDKARAPERAQGPDKAQGLEKAHGPERSDSSGGKAESPDKPEGKQGPPRSETAGRHKG